MFNKIQSILFPRDVIKDRKAHVYMSTRAKACLFIDATFFLVIGLTALVGPSGFWGPTYNAIRDTVPISAWGAIFVVLAGYLSYAGLVGSAKHARNSLMLSAAVKTWWFVGFLLSAAVGGIIGPTIVPCVGALIAWDLVQCRQPSRVAMEDVIDPVPVERA